LEGIELKLLNDRETRNDPPTLTLVDMENYGGVSIDRNQNETDQIRPSNIPFLMMANTTLYTKGQGFFPLLTNIR